MGSKEPAKRAIWGFILSMSMGLSGDD
jgi:hypothetical protein